VLATTPELLGLLWCFGLEGSAVQGMEVDGVLSTAPVCAAKVPLYLFDRSKSSDVKLIFEWLFVGGLTLCQNQAGTCRNCRVEDSGFLKGKGPLVQCTA
jgi:hypothetical protein